MVHGRLSSCLRLFLVVLLVVLSQEPISADIPNNKAIEKFLWSDLPYEISSDTVDFSFNVWLDPEYAKPDQSVQIFVEQNANLAFTPTSFSLKGSDHVTVKAKRTGKDSLVAVVMNPDGGWHYFARTVNFGFTGEMKIEPMAELRSGDIKATSVRFFDAQGKKMGLQAPTMLRIIGSNAKMREVGQTEWKNPLELWLQPGANSSPLLEVTPTINAGGEGRIQAELLCNGEYVLLNSEDLSFATPPTELLVFAMAIIGGLLHSVYELVSGLTKKKVKEALPAAGAKALIGILSGIIAVLFAEKVGIKIDRSSLTGYAALGFLVAYVGVDTVLNKIASSRSTQQDEDHRRQLSLSVRSKSMQDKPDLSPDFCVNAVVNATPKPKNYQAGTAAKTKLFNLGVVDEVQETYFTLRLKEQISPWVIDDADILSSPDTAVQDAAISVENNAK